MEILNPQKLSTIGFSAVADVNNIKRATYSMEATALDNLNNACPYDWLCQKSAENEMCLFWKMVFDFQVNYLIFIRPEREGNFQLYILALRKLIKWYFIFNKFNYSRWLNVHLFDSMTVEIIFPDIYENFNKGFFTFQKLEDQFSQMDLEQFHEQNNRTIKSCGGATDLVNKFEESALIRWEKPSNSEITKMRNACERRPEIAKIVFWNEILNVPQSWSKSYNTMYHGSKSELTKRYSKYSVNEIPKNAEKYAIIIEMSTLIRAKCSQNAGMICFSDLAIVPYYEIMRFEFDCNRITIVFDSYFDDSLKKATRKSRGTGTILIFDDDTDIPQDMIDNFLRNDQNKNNLNEFLSKNIIDLHQSTKYMVVTYKDTVICSTSIKTLDSHDISITHCQSEEADQRLIRHTLHCISAYYKKIVVRTVDTDVLILLKSYVSQFYGLCTDVNTYAHMVNSACEYYDAISAIFELVKETCNGLPFFFCIH